MSLFLLSLSVANANKIHVLDLADLAVEGGFSQCVLEDLANVDPRTGLLQLIGQGDMSERRIGHKQGSQSGPWYLKRVRNLFSTYDLVDPKPLKN